MAKCPSFRHYEQRKHVKSFFHQKIWKVSGQKQSPADVMTFFFLLVFTCFWAGKWTSADTMIFFLVFTCFSAGKWTSADMMVLKEPVLLLHSENIVTLPYSLYQGFLNFYTNVGLLLKQF